MSTLQTLYNKKVVTLDWVAENTRYMGKTVFTNGCFDVVHNGHLDLFLKANKLGDTLIVGINTDESIQELKSNKDIKRPVHNLEDRCLFLSALNFIDYIVPFDDQNPAKILERISPHVFVKGGEYSIEDSIGMGYGADLLHKRNIKYVPIPWVYIDSSTEILKKLNKNEIL